jgi:TonB family protein
MTTYAPGDWDDTGLSSLARSPFLLPSIILHVLFFFFVLRGIGLQLAAPPVDIPIAVDLAEVRDGGSVDKSIGPAKGPGGPRSAPKLGTPVPPAPRTGKIETGSLEASTPSPTPAVESAPPPKPVALPGPKMLASDTRHEAVNVKETSPDSLVRLPTRESPTSLPATATDSDLNQKTLAALKGSGDGPGIKALKEGSQIPGALKGTGTGLGPYGVPGGSRNGTGLAGNGTGTGTGGGSLTGLKGIPNADYNRYLSEIEKRVKSVWKYPDEVTGVQKVTLRFTLDRAGKLVEAEVLESSDSRLNPSAVAAMKRASPFPPIPENLKQYLANEPLIMRFTVTNQVRG